MIRSSDLAMRNALVAMGLDDRWLLPLLLVVLVLAPLSVGTTAIETARAG